MPIQEFCDRCGRDITGKPSGALAGIKDADSEGNGTVTDAFDLLCPPCYRAIVTFARTWPATKPR